MSSEEPTGKDRVLSHVGPHIDEHAVPVRHQRQSMRDSSDQFDFMVRVDDVKVGRLTPALEPTDRRVDGDPTEPELGEHPDADPMPSAKHSRTRKKAIVRCNQDPIARPTSPSDRFDDAPHSGEGHSTSGYLTRGEYACLRNLIHERLAHERRDVGALELHRRPTASLAPFIESEP